jgi:hypothetical protein
MKSAHFHLLLILARLMRSLKVRYMTMGSKIFLILRALLLVVGMFVLQGCFEEEYNGHGGGYAPAYGYRGESPRHEHEEEEHWGHEEGDRD